MIKSLTINGYYVDFSQVNPVQFNMGVSLITGPNGSGKSSIMEMIRFALFGSKALRRPASDYKKLDVTLEFEVRGKGYKVIRSPGQTLLKDAEGTPLAVGTTPVNGAITGLFGYGLTVFDIANCCNQNQVMAFSDRMQPGDRKKLIDQTVGLAAIDDLALELNNEALVLGREITFLTQRVDNGKPEAPTQPSPFRSLEALRDEVAKAQGAWANAKVIQSSLDRLDLTPPVAPQAPDELSLPGSFDPENAKARISELRTRQTRRSFLMGQTSKTPTRPIEPEKPDISFSDDQLSASIEDLSVKKILQQQLAALELPSLTMDDIAQARGELSLWNDFQAVQKLRQQGDAECPACGHHFPNAHKALEHYTHVPAEMTKPQWTADYLFRQESLQANVAKKAEIEAGIAGLDKSIIPDAEALRATLRRYLMQWDSYTKQLESFHEAERGFQAALAELTSLPDAADSIAILERTLELHQSYHASLDKFETARKQHALNVEEHARLSTELEAATLAANTLPALQASLEEHLTYQTAYNAYTKRLEDWQADSDKLAQVSAEYADLKAGRAALLDLKVRIKSYLLPSLNTVATALISEMTGGVLSKLALTDDFEILVDDTPIAAMSGSEQAVANLALRLALGQVLTNRVFSVFMGDELDASMDQDRASYLMECLFRLRNQIGQILLVTHKQFEADHTVQLKRRK